MPLTCGLRWADCMALRMARRKLTRLESCSATPWATSCASDSGFFTSRMFSYPGLPVSFSSSPRMRAASAAHRAVMMPVGAVCVASVRGVDVEADTVEGALDLDLRAPGPLHPLAHELADGHVFIDVVLVQL